ncbi:endonuclease/exonuclease/phosphatase family protein [Modestobacter altitudinis]|uniref:endonuclease/exonuclease/phosphatase family protein n=1 Tax=Modestobacter altitudinis TaxID=2213158 RepID=UPI00110CE7A2|nr:endonuclease/exonuclease/phosphatase family protein [Modestobacter altitudinis]
MSAVRLVTFNTHHGVGDDGRHDLARVARLLDDADPDVICLQEVDRHFGERSEFVDQALLLAEALDRELAWAPSIDKAPQGGRTERRQYGNALLSRLPVRSSEVHALPGGGEPRSALHARLQLEGSELEVVTTHLSSRSPADRAAQAATLARLHPGGSPTVVVGDLNADAGAPELDALRQRFADAWELATDRSDQAGRFSLRGGRGLTHPARRPRVRIDQVWVSPDVSVVDARVLDGAATSDHHPLLVDLVMKDPLSPAPRTLGAGP